MAIADGVAAVAATDAISSRLIVPSGVRTRKAV
jgi:hypothetical protein